MRHPHHLPELIDSNLIQGWWTRWTITRLRICYADNRDHTRAGGDLRRWKRESEERSEASGKLLPDFSELDDVTDDDADDDACDDADDDDDTSEC